jgi:hypothetical protein
MQQVEEAATGRGGSRRRRKRGQQAEEIEGAAGERRSRTRGHVRQPQKQHRAPHREVRLFVLGDVITTIATVPAITTTTTAHYLQYQAANCSAVSPQCFW